jgi:uncharacterized membrane protein YqjE
MDTTTTPSLSDKINRLVNTSREYLESKVELEVLKGADKVAQGMSLFTVILLSTGLALVVLLLVSIGAAILINEALDSTNAGYFIVAGIVLLLMVLFLTLGRNAVRRKVINMILNNIDND